MMEPKFLTVEEVLVIHSEQLDAFGGIHGIRDNGLLESAVMMPQASFGGEYLHTDIFEMAANREMDKYELATYLRENVTPL